MILSAQKNGNDQISYEENKKYELGGITVVGVKQFSEQSVDFGVSFRVVFVKNVIVL